MLEEAKGLVYAIEALWDQHVAMLVQSAALPFINSAGKAVTLIASGVLVLLTAGFSAGMAWSGHQGLPDRMDRMEAQVQRLAVELCILRVTSTGEGDVISCYPSGD